MRKKNSAFHHENDENIYNFASFKNRMFELMRLKTNKPGMSLKTLCLSFWLQLKKKKRISFNIFLIVFKKLNHLEQLPLQWF